MLRAERAARLRCFLAYLEACSPAVPLGKLASSLFAADPVRRLERLTLASNLRFWRQHDRRCLGTNRYFRRLRVGDLVGHAVADLDPEVLAPLLADPDGAFTRPGVRLLKDSPTSTVAEFDLPGPGGPRRVIYKRFAVGGWGDPWVSLFRQTPVLRSYVLGHGLRLRCLPTPRPLAVWQRKRRGLSHEGYLLTEKVPDAVDLLAFVNRLAELPPAERTSVRRRLIDQVARLIGALHHRHLSHRDLKAANLLVSGTPEPGFRRDDSGSDGGAAERGARTVAAAFASHDPVSRKTFQVWFIDLVGVARHRKLRRYRRLQNLARLHASFHRHPGLTRTDKLRFLRVYLRWGLRGRFGWKRWWRQVEELTEAKVRRNLRRGRPLG
jgi:hypothetical protein